MNVTLLLQLTIQPDNTVVHAIVCLQTLEQMAFVKNAQTILLQKTAKLTITPKNSLPNSTCNLII